MYCEWNRIDVFHHIFASSLLVRSAHFLRRYGYGHGLGIIPSFNNFDHARYRA
jgi:hypothetical protein